MPATDRTIAQMADDDFFIAHRSDRLDPVRFDLQRSADPRRAIQSVAEVFCPHRIVRHDPGAPLDFRHSSARIAQTTFNQIAYGSCIDVLVDDVNRAQYIFVLQLRGEMHVTGHGAQKTITSGEYMVLGPDTPYRFVHEANDAHLAVGMPRRMIELGDQAYGGPSIGIEPETVEGVAGSLVDYLSFVCRELQRGGAAFESAGVRNSTEDMIAGMMKSILAARTPSPATAPGVAPAHVHRAEAFMDAHLQEDLSIEAIAAAAGVPERTLHHAFARFRGTSPMQWLRTRRLEHARREILASGGSANILQIANRYGMQHGGRFATYYQQHFHERPSDTLRIARVGESDPARIWREPDGLAESG
ncbi:AraC family transcriptional regulator [Sphingomonas sp. TDK1]|uniref:AraC family transcriptional regulator n=1 Tax=Sphingomonas sp. TDK1 TaxID=453247 RepID=UPI0007D9DE99|nr:AraC family transcriptional regulator [Sphingomonas sp. TDK1]OAN64781.1 hypothetical protein A7X12_01255 [Sphingomonas sp. TDK1]